MATTINAGNATSGAAISADTTGILQLQSGASKTTAITVDASQNVGIGTTTPATNLNAYNATSAIISVDGDAITQFRASRYSTDATSPFFVSRKARGTLASPTTVASSDLTGVFQNQAYDGTQFRTLSSIQAAVETYTGSDNLSGQLLFAVRPNGAAAANTEQMRITSAGELRFNSGYGSVAAAYGCRAWVNFNGSGLLTGTYSQSAFAITVTVTSHGLSQGQSVYITFQTGTASAEAFTVTSVTNANVFVVTSTTSRTASGNCTLATIIRASGNVSSVTDNGTGDYTVNFTNAMPDANYSAQVSAQGTVASYLQVFMFGTNAPSLVSPTTSSFRFWTGNYNNASANSDSAIVTAAVFR